MSSIARGPVLIRGLSRSGGTLLVTMWDAHPDVSMSYELYPNLLDGLISNTDNIDFFLDCLRNEKLIKKKFTGDKNKLKTFVARTYRSGLESKDLVKVYESFISTGESPFSSPDHIMKFIEGCARAKMVKEKKSMWGMKCSGDYNRYLDSWPNAIFFNIVRDGRDVLASQLLTGSFNKTVSEVADGYVSNHRKFLKFLEDARFCGMNVEYEMLVNDSSNVVKKMCEFVGVEFSPEMLNFYKKDLTIYKKSMGHLSRDRINKPIDSKMLGRWKNDLNENQIKEFESIAFEMLSYFKYMSYCDFDWQLY